MSKAFFGVALLAIVLFACSVDAHAWMSNPSPRGQYRSPKKQSHEEYAPTAGNTPDSQEFVCRNDPVMPKANWISLTAGRSQSITLEFNAVHPGDCFVYLTYDGDKSESQMKWFKIWEQHECYKKTNYEVPIPSYLPSGDHVIFRWEWYALHAQPTTVEYYTQCVDAVMSGSSSGSLPQPQVNIPGHLPKTSGNFLAGNNNYWWPYDNQPMFFTGPAVASLIVGQPSTPAPTTKPTTPPTTKPTNPPTTPPTTKPTTPPTTAPTVTPKPTNPPTNPPTTAPTSTPKPTTAPTTAPTAAPTTAPTTKPTAAPTTRPDSVKLNINPSSSTWWFACSVSGARSSEVSKIEIKDSGSFSSYKTMKNEWADVYSYAPEGIALVLPITIKASLPSGNSMIFTVNSISSSLVDSGATFA